MKRVTRVLAAAAAAGALVLTGCASGGGSGSGKGSGDAPAASDINAMDRSKLKEGGKLRLEIGTFPANFNYNQATGNTADYGTIHDFTMPTNFDNSADNKRTPNPNFIKDVKVEDGPPQVVTLTLNPDAKWGNGDPITAKDYIATWKALNGENEGFEVSSTDGYREVKEVKQGKDEFEVVTTFKSTYPDWQAMWSTVENAEAVKDPETFNTARQKEPHPEWTAGPFKISKVDQAQKMITLVPNENWWGDKPLLDEMTFKAMTPDLRGNAFANNEIDVVTAIVTKDEFDKVQQRSGAQVRAASGLQWRHITFNNNAGNLRDKNVRQAIVKGTNRKAIAASDLAGLPVDVDKLMVGNHFFAPTDSEYADNSTDFKYDPKAAEKQLDDAGWKKENGKDYRMKDGKELEIKYSMLVGIPTSENEGKLFQDDMKKIGVKVNLVNTSQEEWQNVLQNRQFESVSFAWQSTVFPMNNITQLYGCEAPQNYSDACNETIKELTPKADTELDQKKRAEIVNEIDKAIWDEVMVMPLYRRMDFTAVPSDLANFGSFGLASPRAENIGFVK